MPRYIDADEVKKAIEESWDGCLGSYDSHEIIMNDLWVIDKVPTADAVERKKGKWIAVKIGNGDTRYTCSECGASYECDSRDAWDFKFCPNCGAQMER